MTATKKSATAARLQLIELAGLVETHVRAPSLDWPQTANLMLGNMTRMGRAIASLSDEFRYDAAILTRSLFEHAVKFSWLCIDPVAHFDRWKQSDLANRRKAVNDAGSLDIAEVASVVLPDEPDKKREGPSLIAMCDAVDAFWLPRLPGGAVLKRYSYRGLYVGLYRHFSAATHGEALAIQSLVTQTDRGLRDDLSAPVFEPALTVAPIVLALALFTAQLTLGYPNAPDIFAAFERVAG